MTASGGMVLGLVLLSCAALSAGLMALDGVALWQGHRVKVASTRVLNHLVGPAGQAVEVIGTVAGPATLRAPLTGEPCVGWVVRLEYGTLHSGDDGYTWSTVWQGQAAADLDIGYDRTSRKALRSLSAAKQLSRGDGTVLLSLAPKFPAGSTADPGVLRVPGDRVDLNGLTPGGRRVRQFDLSPQIYQSLSAAGLPDRLKDAYPANGRSAYLLRQDVVTTGDPILLCQRSPSPSGSSMPDPEAQYFRDHVQTRSRYLWPLLPVLASIAVLTGVYGWRTVT